MSNYQPHADDLYDEAMTERQSFFAGQVATNAFKCVLIKGTRGPVPYEPTIHGQDAKVSTAIEFIITPLQVDKNFVAKTFLNWEREFTQAVRPSIEKLAEKIAGLKGIDASALGPGWVLREMNQMFVIGEWVPKPDNKEGENYKTLSFVDIFATQQECQNAFVALLAENGADVSKLNFAGAQPAGMNQPQFQQPVFQQPAQKVQQPVQTTAPTQPQNLNDPQRAAMAGFLPGLWQQSGNQPAEFIKLIQAQPMMAQYFDASSPEVIALTGGVPS